ncbi:hypothetical protein L7F22_006955 [Adiantum nelumboides]|nr:hypothetical protein [Adiantum nelumboides]
MARVEARRKELADARAAKATGKTRPMTMEEARIIRLEKSKAIQKERRRIEAEQRVQEEAEAAKAAQTQETEVVDLSGTLEYLKRLEREKHTAEQRAGQLAREKIKEALSRKAEEPVLEPTQGSPKRPRQEEEDDIEDIQADPIPPSPISIPPAPPSSPITPFPPASTPQTPPFPSPLDIPLLPPAPTSPQQQHPSAETTQTLAPITQDTSQPMEASPEKETAQPMHKADEEKQLEGEQHQQEKVDVPILLVQDEEPSSQEAILEVKSFDYTVLLQTLTRQFQCQQVVAKETEIQRTRANQAEEEMANLRTALELSQLTRKEAQNHELIKNDKKMKEQLKHEDARYQKLNASYNTVKNTLTALLQNQEPAAEAPSTSDSAALNTLPALQAELQTEKLQRQLLVSGFMSQTAQHEAKVKQLEEELAKAKANLAAVGSLASASQFQQAETHEPIQPSQLPEMPEIQGMEEEEQQRPAPGALDIREEIEQELEDLPEGPAKEYLLYEKKVMQSAALAFLQPEEQVKDFGTDFLPLPLMRHEAILWKEKVRPAVQRNEDGGYEGIALTTEEAKTLIEDHPRWRRKWLSERPRDLTNFHNTPQSLQIDPTYCPVPRRRTWAEFQKWRGKNKALLNYPVLSAQEPPTVNYVVNTLNTTIQLLREVPDIACQMLVKIARMIVTCIQVFKDTEDDDHHWNLFLEGSTKKQMARLRVRACALVNTRKSPGLQELKSMLSGGAQARWGNNMGYVILPVPLLADENPLNYVHKAKSIIDKKKLSLGAAFSYASGKFLISLIGSKVPKRLTYNCTSHTTLAFSNIFGPLEEIQFFGHPVTHIIPTVAGQPQALCVHVQSYMGKVTLVVSSAKDIIPDPERLCQYMVCALEDMKKMLPARKEDDQRRQQVVLALHVGKVQEETRVGVHKDAAGIALPHPSLPCSNFSSKCVSGHRTVKLWVKKVCSNRDFSLISLLSRQMPSYRLGVHGPNADINALCIDPQHASQEHDFFVVLHGMLQEMPEVTKLHLVLDAHVPLLKFKFQGISVDLLYAGFG